MSHRNAARVDRFAQMSKQEELIAKKRQEILDKQRTTQLAKAVVAAQTLAAKLKTSERESKPETNTSDSGESVTQNDESIEQISEEIKKDDVELLETPAVTKPSLGIKSNIGKISFGSKRIAVPIVEQPPSKVQNSFCNDGSFLENFKKILEKHEKPKVPTIMNEAVSSATAMDEHSSTSNVAGGTSLIIETSNSDVPSGGNKQQFQGTQQSVNYIQTQQSLLPSTAGSGNISSGGGIVPSTSATASSSPQYIFNPNIIHQSTATAPATNIIMGHQRLQQPPPLPAALGNYISQPPQNLPVPVPMPVPQHHPHHHHHHHQQQAAAAAAVALSAAYLQHIVPPPPPPPPQIPLALANLSPLYMIPAPEPIQLNTIPPPKEFDLNAIPKPQVNLEAIQVPIPQIEIEQIDQQIEKEKEQQNTTEPENNCLQLPTTIENLIEMVIENGGDEYDEDKLRLNKTQLHPSLWFLFDKNCEQYQQYRIELNKALTYKLEMSLNEGSSIKSENVSSPNELETEQVIDNKEFVDTNCVKNEYEPESLNVTIKEKEEEEKEKEDVKDVLDEKIEDVKPSYSGGLVKTHLKADFDSDDKYDPETAISGDIDSDDEYMRSMLNRNRDNIKRRIECRNELSEEERQEREAELEEERRRLERKKLRKSRWGEKVQQSLSASGTGTSFGNQNKPILTKITRNDPALLQYARLNYGSTNLSEEDWRKCEEHYKVNLLYQDMMRKRQEIDRLAKSGKFKYEYDSDEDVDGGTWEHKLRCAEMEATQAWAQALTKQSEGKHHIGDFLPPEELKKFMEQYEAKKNNRQPDLSDYKEYKLKEDNIGFQMLQKLGWKEGQGLGSEGAGIVNPVNKGPQRDGNQGLGITSVSTPEDCDNEYDAYRKRMMLAYRFRPNPLNNPRRAYY